jgi:uroporphyrinogen decarboxylase
MIIGCQGWGESGSQAAKLEANIYTVEEAKSMAAHICLLGNVDLNLLGLGEPEQVDSEVRELIKDIGPGGGYIVTSGNSLAGYLQPDNVLALGRAVQKYGRYPLNL